MHEDDTEDAQPRTARAIAERVLALIAVTGHVHFTEHNAKWMADNAIDQYLSDAERAFVAQTEPSKKDKANFSWRAEALMSLIWCLNGVDDITALNVQFDAFRHPMVLTAAQQTSRFLEEAVRRPEEELADMEQFLYHQHWRVRDRDLGFHSDRPEPGDAPIDTLDSGIVYERRYAMSWVVGYGDSWDDVPTDT